MKIGIDLDIQSTSVPVRWCLGRDEINKLAETGEKALILLLVVSDNGQDRSETRSLIPVEQMMEYVNFYTPGKHKIFSTVVWKKYKNSDLNKFFLSKGDDRYYRNSLYDYYDKKLFENDSNVFCSLGVHKFEVNVPKEVFAKEPPAWEKSWVNWFYEGKPKDQCYYRRRRLFAYSVQPSLVLVCFFALEIATFSITLALLLFGMKGIGFRKIIHPFLESFSSIWDETKGSIFGEWIVPRLLPSIFLGSSLICWATCKIFSFQIFGFQTTDWIKAIITGGIVVGAVATASVFTSLCCLGVSKIVDKIRDTLESKDRMAQKKLRAEVAEKERGKKLRERIEAEYALLACNGNFSVDMQALPPEKRTIHLRYKELKSRRCKSFAR